jgi:hypothetical protein
MPAMPRSSMSRRAKALPDARRAQASDGTLCARAVRCGAPTAPAHRRRTLGKNVRAAEHGVAVEATHTNNQQDAPSGDGQSRQAPAVPAVHAFASRAASRGTRSPLRWNERRSKDADAARLQRRSSESLPHDVLSVVTTSAESMPMLSHSIKFESEPCFAADPHT